ncbi:MAG: UbiX family flavin prenyltransferase [Leptospiraceae bacterium]|nr:UbiX family flavin prenyltransferase [Leptospiraceae bacterium]
MNSKPEPNYPAREWHLVIGVSGASGALYARALVRALSQYVVGASDLIVSPAALRVAQAELGFTSHDARQWLQECLAGLDADSSPHQFTICDHSNIGARAASGSVPHDGMLIVPCSMKSLAGIAHGYTTNLIERAADVCLKERRPLVLMPRESPYNAIHLQNMQTITAAGGIVLPASPGFYQLPRTLEDLANNLVSRALALVGLEAKLLRDLAQPYAETQSPVAAPNASQSQAG